MTIVIDVGNSHPETSRTGIIPRFGSLPGARKPRHQKQGGQVQ
jgi:hypothetical protein